MQHIYILIIFFSHSQVLPVSPHLLSQPPFCSFLFQKQNKTNKNQHTQTHTQHRVCFVLDNYPPGHRTCPVVSLIYPVPLHWRKLLFPLPAGVSHRFTFLVQGGGTCVGFPFSVLEFCPVQIVQVLCLMSQSAVPSGSYSLSASLLALPPEL